MVYRDMPLEEAETAYKAITQPDLPDVAEQTPMETKIIPKKPRKKVVKALLPKSK